MNIKVRSTHGLSTFRNVVISWKDGTLAIYRGNDTKDIVSKNFCAAYSRDTQWMVITSE